MIKFYGYKRCSTSRKARKWMDDHQVNYEFQDLVEQPPKKEDLVKWMTKYQDRGLKYFFNTHGQDYRRENLKDQTPSADTAEQHKKQQGRQMDNQRICLHQGIDSRLQIHQYNQCTDHYYSAADNPYGSAS